MVEEKKLQQMNFDADVAQLIHLVTHSIYSNKEVFLRELLANANDAIQKAKIKSAQDVNYLGDETDFSIHIKTDEKNGTIIIEDTGVGMSHDEVIQNLGTIAKSGTKAFIEAIKEQNTKNDKNSNGGNSDMIGQFGIGFYSAFMVAKKVQVETKSKESEDGVLWSSDGGGSYEISSSEKKSRGTTITLFLHDEAKEFASYHKIKGLITKHANYVPVAIRMPVFDDKGEQTEKREQVNAMKSIWTKQKSEVKKEEYKDFYQSLTFDQEEPLDTIHLHIEGMINFKALLFIPKNAPIFGHMDPEKEYGPSLYVQNVLIMENAKELLPVWLRFVKGVIETPDLSLNVSRELIQSNDLLGKIQKTLVKEVLKSLRWQLESEPKQYAVFYKNYCRYLKEGVHYDWDNKESIAGLLLYHSLKEQKDITLDEYVQKVSESKENEASADATTDASTDSNNEAKTESSTEKSGKGGDKESSKDNESNEDKALDPIIYLTGSSLTQLQGSPYIEQFEGTQTDVLLMDDPIDEWVVQALDAYKKHPLRSASSLENKSDDTNKDKIKELEKKSKEQKGLLQLIKKTVGDDKLEEVRLSHKLKSSMAMLVRKDGQSSAQMERIMQAMGQEMTKGKRILELNADHPVVQKMIELHKTDSNNTEIKELSQYAYEQAVLLEGGTLDDMNAFLRRVNNLLS